LRVRSALIVVAVVAASASALTASNALAGGPRVAAGPGRPTVRRSRQRSLLNAADGHGGDSVDGGTGTDHYRSDQGDSVVHAEVRSTCTV
jgi:hypothetical protein